MPSKSSENIVLNSLEELVSRIKFLAQENKNNTLDEPEENFVCELCCDTGWVHYDSYQEAGEIVDATRVKCNCGQ